MSGLRVRSGAARDAFDLVGAAWYSRGTHRGNFIYRTRTRVRCERGVFYRTVVLDWMSAVDVPYGDR